MKMQRTKTMGAAACALLLCAAMVAGMSSLGAGDAHADGSASEGAASTSATRVETKPIGYYASGTNSSIDGTGEDLSVQPGAGGYNTSGELVTLSGLEFRGGKAYIAADKLTSFLSSTGLAIYDSPNNSLGPNLSWWELVSETTVEVPDPVIEPIKPEQPLPDTGKDTTDNNTDNSTKEPEKTPDPVTPSPEKPTNNDSQTVDRTSPTPTEPEIFSLKCRQSESEAKIAELESQGYEIIRVERLPKWLY